MSNYQKVYMNQIHSSSLLCQLAHMWKTQVLCDAIIRTGTIITKAHRVVLVAACPMLQSMENAAAGSHLEVRLAADIKQESVNTFLQYLYEGFMMLTEENCREVEKVARLLQVDNVIKCCADFYKCLQNKTGATIPTQYKYSFQDMVEFRHVRTTDLQKTTQERLMKRTSDFNRPESPSHKRQRMHRGGSPDISGDRADDTATMSHSYTSMPDPWDRVPRLGSGMSKTSKSQPGVIDIVEESLEMFQHDPHGKKDGQTDSRIAQKSAAVSIAISSQMNTAPDVSIVNISGAKDTGQRGSITVDPLHIDNSNVQISSPSSSSSMSAKPNFSSRPESHHRPSSQQQQPEFSPQVHHHQDVQFSSFSQDNEDMFSSKQQPRSSNSDFSTSTPSRPHPVPVSLTTNQNKPFAIGSASQSGPSSSPSTSRNIPGRTASASTVSSSQDYRGDKDNQNLKSEDSNSNDVDLSIVKVETAQQMMSHSAPGVARGDETGGLDMHVDTEEGAVSFPQQGMVLQEQEGEELSDAELEDWAREEMSNEGSNISGDQNWFPQAYKGHVMPPVQDERMQTKTKTSLQTFQSDVCKMALETNGQYWVQGQNRFVPQNVQCEICRQVLTGAEHLKQHLLTKHGDSYSHFCFPCGKGFRSYPGFFNHEKMYHRDGYKCPKCDVCGKMYPCKSSLETHMKKHSDARPFSCDICGKAFKHKQTLKEHSCVS